MVLRSFFDDSKIEAGCDEAGRGCLAGPVFAAAVILSDDFSDIGLLNDSKKLTQKKREKLLPIIERESLACSVAWVDHQKIDEINILNASILAMHLAIDGLNVRPEQLLIDGNRFTPYLNINHRCIVRGDSIYASIAAASILAKVYRDRYMSQLSDQYPLYGWKKNKGYPTRAHREAISTYGLSPYHRLSFGRKNID